MSDLSPVDESNFQAQVLEASLPVLVEFGAVWCSPCKMLEPLLNDLAKEWSGKVSLVKVDVDESVNLTMQYQVMGVPTVMLFQDGKPVERFTGYQSKDRIVSKLSPHLGL